MRLAVVGAHAFDAEAMAGPLALRVRQHGGSVLLVHVTRGERGHPTLPPDQYGPQLEVEMRRAAQTLDVDYLWPGFLAGHLPPISALADRIASILVDYQPDLVVTHWRGSWHPTHRQVHDAVRAAYHTLVKSGTGEPPSGELGRPPRIQLWFGENLEDLDGFRPSVYVDVSTTIEQWKTALSCYELYSRTTGRRPDGDFGSIPYREYYAASTRVRGLEVGVEHAQGFMTAPLLYQ